MMLVEAHRTKNGGLVKELITSPELWDTIAEDGQKPEDFTPDTTDEVWLVMVSDDDGIVGLYNLHVRTCVTLEIHAHVFPEFRKKYSRDTGLAALTWIRDNAPEYHKVIAQIPEIYENVKNFTCSFGFKVEGTNRKSYLKHGKIVDQWLLGITREELEASLK